VSEHSHAERLPRRAELSPEELALLLGADRFDAAGESTEPGPVVVETHDAAAAPETTTPADAVQPPTGAPRPVGDTDLVQAILEQSPNFEDLALRAVRERTGEPLARIVTGGAAEAMVAAGTASALGADRAFVAPMPPDRRHAWALWLGRWLVLRQRTSHRAALSPWDDATGYPAWQRARPQVAQRIAASRMRREPLFLSILSIRDEEFWNRRSQVLVDDAFLMRAAAAIDAAVHPGDELSRLDADTFVVASGRASAAAELAQALRAEIARLPGDGPRSLSVAVGAAEAPWDATDPDALLAIACERAAAAR
jgi:GGDEF domain-containing protein